MKKIKVSVAKWPIGNPNYEEETRHREATRRAEIEERKLWDIRDPYYWYDLRMFPDSYFTKR